MAANDNHRNWQDIGADAVHELKKKLTKNELWKVCIASLAVQCVELGGDNNDAISNYADQTSNALYETISSMIKARGIRS